MKLAIMISDRRMKEIYRKLSTFYTVTALYEHSDFLAIKDIDVLILPVKGIDEFGHLHTENTVWEIPEGFWKELPMNCLIFAGLANPYLQGLNRACYYYMQNEQLLEKNAELTAEGVLFLLIDSTAKGIGYLHVDIIGYGRCGKAIARWLEALHVPVRIIRRVSEKGDDHQVSVDEYKQTEPGDVIINTSIQKLMTRDLMVKWESKPLIIDIATPDVVDSEDAKLLGIRFIKAGNLPAIVAYESAGDFIADYIKGVIEHGE